MRIGSLFGQYNLSYTTAFAKLPAMAGVAS
jgi:hypothetical protein